MPEADQLKKLALCIPAYNAAWCLPSLLQTACNQSIPFDEIWVYDDFSSDNTSEVAQQYGASVIRGSQNRGCSIGKNILAEAASSTWIHFHDADDILLPNFTEIAHQWIEKTNSPDIVLLNYEYRNFKDNTLLGSPEYDREALLRDPVKFVLENKIVNFALCKRSSFLKIGGFDLDTKVLYNEDRAFYTKAIIAGLTFDYEKEVTCINYAYTESMSASNVLKCTAAYLEVSKKAARVFGKSYPSSIAKGLWNNASTAASFQDWALVKENLRLAIRLNGRRPIDQSNWINVFSLIHPYFSYWSREKLIRLFKPGLRPKN